MARTNGEWQERIGQYLEPIYKTGRSLLIRGTNKFINFGTVFGADGYGVRDNGGRMEFKHSGESWEEFGGGSAPIAGDLIFKGTWDASAGTFPGSGTALQGWFYKVSVAGTVDGVSFAVGDNLFAIADNASTSTFANNWEKIDNTEENRPRTSTITSAAQPSINTDLVDHLIVTAQAEDITSMTANLTGTPQAGQKLMVSITGTAARAITWGASFENGPVALPTTTVTTTRLDVFFVYDAQTSKWRCMASGSTV